MSRFRIDESHSSPRIYLRANDVDGTDAQNFLVYDVVAAATRLCINSTGNVKVKNLVG